MKGLFVTGTDTGVGKTLVSCALLSALKRQGYVVQGMKPVASGCEHTAQGLRNDDAQRLMQHSTASLPYSTVNPYTFEEAAAPHLLAAQSNVVIDADVIRQKYLEISSQCQHVIVEGAGGWQVPLNHRQSMADLAVLLQLPVVLVVGIRLGCINHALLTYRSIIDSGLSCLGWVANEIEATMSLSRENIQSIEHRIDAPLLGRIPYSEWPDIQAMADSLDLSYYVSRRV